MSQLAIVTGASRGIGRATCLGLVQLGYRVLSIARSESELASLAQEAQAGPGTILPCALDLTDPAAVDRAMDEVLARHGDAAVLVNNAGIGIRGAIEDLPLDQCKRLFDLNFFSVVQVTQKVLPGMRKAGHGTIVNISSVAGLVSNPFGGMYSASKFALEALSDALRLELRPRGIRVVLIEPGPVATDFVRAAAEQSDAILDDPRSAYAKNYESLRDAVRWVHGSAISSEAVAKIVLKAIRASRPKARYAAHSLKFHLPSLLRRLAPAAVLDAVLAKRLGLK